MWQPFAGKSLLSFLKGRAGSICAAGGVAGPYRDLSSGTIGFAIVINTILHVTANSLDMLLGAIRTTSALFVSAVHFATSFTRLVVVFTDLRTNIHL